MLTVFFNTRILIIQLIFLLLSKYAYTKDSLVFVDGYQKKVDVIIRGNDERIKQYSHPRFYKAGTTIGIESGVRTSLSFFNLHGTEEEPISIINIGEVLIQGRNTGIAFYNCKHIRLLGSGNSDCKYGIKILKTGLGKQGIDINQKSSNFEVAFIEIANTGFCGIMAKTDNRNKNKIMSWVLSGLDIHHNFIHDTHGEGLYIGQTVTWGHAITDVKVHHNLIINTGWDGAQLANCSKNIEFNNNTIYNFGTANKSQQNNGLQIGDWTVGKFHHNVIEKGTGHGIINMGSGDIIIYKNYIGNTKQMGTFIDNRQITIKGSSIIYRNNFFVNNTGNLLTCYNELNNVYFLNNNYNIKNSKIILSGGATSKNVFIENNKVKDLDPIEFVNPSASDFKIRKTSSYFKKRIGYFDEVLEENIKGNKSESDTLFLKEGDIINIKDGKIMIIKNN